MYPSGHCCFLKHIQSNKELQMRCKTTLPDASWCIAYALCMSHLWLLHGSDLAEFLRRARKERKEMLDKDLQLDLIKAVETDINWQTNQNKSMDILLWLQKCRYFQGTRKIKKVAEVCCMVCWCILQTICFPLRLWGRAGCLGESLTGRNPRAKARHSEQAKKCLDS